VLLAALTGPKRFNSQLQRFCCLMGIPDFPVTEESAAFKVCEWHACSLQGLPCWHETKTQTVQHDTYNHPLLIATQHLCVSHTCASAMRHMLYSSCSLLALTMSLLLSCSCSVLDFWAKGSGLTSVSLYVRDENKGSDSRYGLQSLCYQLTASICMPGQQTCTPVIA
jgi:hypothetical protein